MAGDMIGILFRNKMKASGETYLKGTINGEEVVCFLSKKEDANGNKFFTVKKSKPLEKKVEKKEVKDSGDTPF